MLKSDYATSVAKFKSRPTRMSENARREQSPRNENDIRLHFGYRFKSMKFHLRVSKEDDFCPNAILNPLGDLLLVFQGLD